MRVVLYILGSLSLSACGTVGLQYYNTDTGEDLEPGDAPPYGGDTEINEDDTGLDTEDTEDTQDTEDTDTNGGNNGGNNGGGGTEPQESNPTLSITNVEDDATSLTITFRLDDDDNDIQGGSLSLSIGSDSHTLNIPGDLDTWNQGGNSKLTVEIDHCALSGSPSISMRATDTTGLSSSYAQYTHSMDTDTLNIDSGRSDDHSDTYTSLGYSGVNLGTLSRPSVICGNIYQASNDGKAFTGDLDYLDFSTSFGGSTDLTLTWSATGDYDLYLYNGSSGAGIDASYTDGNTQPEAISTSMSSGSAYVLLIAGWSGSAGDWKLVID